LAGKNEQTEVKLYIPVKAESDRRSFDSFPVKASGDLKKGNCLLLPYISGSSLPMALIKSDYVLKIYQIGCAKIQHKSP
jgi:hypothetical protein